MDPADRWPVGTRVFTTLGSGRIVQYRHSDGLYELSLPYGVAYVKPSTIIGAEELSPLALQAIGVGVPHSSANTSLKSNSDTNPTSAHTHTNSGSPHSTSSSAEETAEEIFGGSVKSSGSKPHVKDPSKVFYGTQMCYLFLRLHHIIYTRLMTARQLAQEQEG
jgi:hypothetical protein